MTKKRLLPFTEQKNYRPISDDGSFGGRSLVLGYVHFVKQEQRRVRCLQDGFRDEDCNTNQEEEEEAEEEAAKSHEKETWRMGHGTQLSCCTGTNFQ